MFAPVFLIATVVYVALLPSEVTFKILCGRERIAWKVLCRRQERVLSTFVLHCYTQGPDWHLFLQIVCGCL